MKSIVVYLFILLWVNALCGQDDFQVSNYGIKEGLSDRVIWDIYQDTSGFIWLATDNGLDRFDGHDFVNFSDNQNPPFRLSDRAVRNIYQVNNGTGLLKYNLGQSFELFNFYSFERSLISPPDNSYTYHSGDRSGNILFSAFDGEFLKIFHYEDGTYILQDSIVFEDPDLPNLRVIETKPDQFFITDGASRLILLEGGKVIWRHELPIDPDYDYWKKIAFVQKDKNNVVWVAYRDAPGVFQLDVEGKDLTQVKLSDEVLYYHNTFSDSKGRTILCTTADRYGLYPDIEHLFLLDGEFVEDYSHLLSIDKKINVLRGQDFRREIFLGSHKGLAIIHFGENAIKKLLYESDLESTYGASMRGIQELGDGTMFMSHETNVLYKLDSEGNLKKIRDLLPYSVEEVNDWACSNQLLIHNDNVWMSGCNISDMAKGMIFRIDPISEEVLKIDMPYRIQSMDLDSEGVIWMVGNGKLGDGHLIRFNPESLEYKLFSAEENPILESFPNYVKCIMEGDIYIGTSDKGLIRFNPVDQSVKRYRIGNSQNGLSSNTIYVIHESQDGGIWCGTSEGLNRLDPDTDEIEHYSISDGLSSNLVVGIIEDELGNFWLSSYYGMSYFDRRSGIFRNFTTDDGLSDNEFNRFSFFKDDEGMIYMGGINGVNVFDPEVLLKSQRSDRLTLTSVNAFDQSLDTIFSKYNELDQNNGLNLPSEIGYLEVKVLLDDFNTPEDHQFFSWMKGLEADYQYVGNRPTIRYNKIPPGSYQLHIKGADSKGNFAANEIILSVMVALPYYETLWFRLLILLGISLIVWAVARFQYHQKLQKEKFRTKVSSDLHDEVSGQLASIATRTELLGMKMKDNGMRESMVEVASKSREVMSRVSDVLWSIDGRKDTFGDLEDRIKNHLDELFGDMEFKIKYRSSGIEPQTPLPQDVRENLYFLIKEAINNIAKHSNGDLISVSIDQENGKCVTIIYDNGNLNSGHNKKASGQGIENMKVRAERLKGQIIFDDTDGYKVEFEMKGVG